MMPTPARNFSFNTTPTTNHIDYQLPKEATPLGMANLDNNSEPEHDQKQDKQRREDANGMN